MWFWDDSRCPVCAVRSTGRCNTIWYEAVFKGGVYDSRETVWAFGGAEERRVASLEDGTDVSPTGNEMATSRGLSRKSKSLQSG
jgi:hypothetical protein